MAGESSSTKLPRSKLFGGQLAHKRPRTPFRGQLAPTPIGACVVALAEGIKPGQWLAERAGFDEHHANKVINGTRKPSWPAIRAIIDEIDERG